MLDSDVDVVAATVAVIVDVGMTGGTTAGCVGGTGTLAGTV